MTKLGFGLFISDYAGSISAFKSGKKVFKKNFALGNSLLQGLEENPFKFYFEYFERALAQYSVREL